MPEPTDPPAHEPADAHTFALDRLLRIVYEAGIIVGSSNQHALEATALLLHSGAEQALRELEYKPCRDHRGEPLPESGVGFIFTPQRSFLTGQSSPITINGVVGDERSISRIFRDLFTKHRPE